MLLIGFKASLYFMTKTMNMLARTLYFSLSILHYLKEF